MPRGMTPMPFPIRGAPRLLAVAVAIMPMAAHAAVDGRAVSAVNGKPGWFGSDMCRKAAGLTPHSNSLDAPLPAAPPAAPSALERMRLSQEGVAIVTAQATPAVIIRAAQPAGCASGLAEPLPVADPTAELGTTAIPVDHTRFDERWDHVRRAAPARLMRTQLRRAGVTRGLGEAETLERVNLWVNRHISYANDDRTYRRSDFWATADETIARGTGDCEDFAILKMQLLRAAGIGGERVKLVLLRDLALNADHALLLVQSRTGWVALDNMTDRIYDGSRSNAMRPILSFSGNQRWIHGYRDAASTPMASALPAAYKALSPATTSPVPDVRLSAKAARDDAHDAGLRPMRVAAAR